MENSATLRYARDNLSDWRPHMKKIGLLINPIAGMGGKVGLKGTDGQEILAEAISRGAMPESAKKAVKALEKLKPLKESIVFLVVSGEMGESVVADLGFRYEVLHQIKGESSVEDSRLFLERLLEDKVDLLLFAGGDGTARNVADTLPFEKEIPVIGIPTGVKIHSPVYAVTPEDAGELAFEFLSDHPLAILAKEVIDIEEAAFRRDEIITKVYGYLHVPYDESHMQNLKAPSLQSDAEAQISAALQVIDDMDEDVIYIIGSGSTTHRILEELGLKGTVLGIDLVKNKKLIAKDVYEQQILDVIGDAPAKLILSPMGGQSYLFGRGNQQLSDKVLAKLDKEDLIILSTPTKLHSLKRQPFLVYTGNPEIDQKISGFYKVVTGYGQYSMYKAVPAAE